MNKPITNGRVTLWLLLLQEFNITIIDRPGKENLVADFLSCVQHEDSTKPVGALFLMNIYLLYPLKPLSSQILLII